MKHCLRILAISAISLLWPEAGHGADIHRVLAILEAIKNRQDSYNPVDVQYKVKRTYTKYYFASAQHIDPSDHRLFSTLRDAAAVLRFHYSMKGDRQLTAVEGSDISAQGKVENSNRSISAYDGALFKTTGDNSRVVAVSRKKPTVQDPLSIYNGEQTLVRLLSSLKGGTKLEALTVTDNPGRVPGVALYFRIVFGKDDQESIQDVWVSSADKSYCVIRFESRLGGKLFHEYSDCEYKQVDGIWFPFKAVYRNYYHNKNVHQLAKEERFEVERITCRADEIPDTQFEIPVTSETEVIDRDRNNLRIVGTDKVDKHILEAVADVERERGSSGWSWLYVSVSVLLLLGAVYLGIRIIHVRRRAKLR